MEDSRPSVADRAEGACWLSATWLEASPDLRRHRRMPGPGRAKLARPGMAFRSTVRFSSGPGPIRSGSRRFRAGIAARPITWWPKVILVVPKPFVRLAVAHWPGSVASSPTTKTSVVWIETAGVAAPLVGPAASAWPDGRQLCCQPAHQLAVEPMLADRWSARLDLGRETTCRRPCLGRWFRIGRSRFRLPASATCVSLPSNGCPRPCLPARRLHRDGRLPAHRSASSIPAPISKLASTPVSIVRGASSAGWMPWSPSTACRFASQVCLLRRPGVALSFLERPDWIWRIEGDRTTPVLSVAVAA